MYKDMIKPALVLTVICIVVSLLVSITDFITADVILQQETETAEASRKAVLPYAESFTQVENDAFTAFMGLDEDGEIIGYAITTSAKGYGGRVQVMTGLDINGIVTGVEILSEEETEGLGKKANKEEFRSLFIGKEVEKYSVVKIKAEDEGDIVAITGATVTTNAVTDAVNEAKAIYAKIGR